MAKYQVSTDLKFDKQTDRDETANYLDGKRPSTFTEPGDIFIVENCIDGTFRVSCTYRFNGQADRDEVYNYLQTQKGKARPDMPGHIEQHTCEHPETKPCHSQIMDRWGKNEDMP